MHDLCYHPSGLYELDNTLNNYKDYLQACRDYSFEQYKQAIETLELTKEIIKNIPRDIVVKNVLKIP